MTIEEDIRTAVDDLVRYGAEKVILFGSAARGDCDEHSDLDFVVIKNTSERFVERLVSAGRAVRSSLSVDVFVYTPEEFRRMVDGENPFIMNVLSEGKVLFEREADHHPPATPYPLAPA